jgi:hypothetical protein
MGVTERIIISQNRNILSTKTMSTRVADSTQILQKRRYIIGKTIGEGTVSKVKVAYKIENGYRKRTACKEINRAEMSSLTLYKFLPREMFIIRTLVHPLSLPSMTPRTFKDASTFPWKFAREEISLV